MNSGQGWGPAWCKLSYFFSPLFFFLILLKSLIFFLSLQHSKLTPWQKVYFYLLYWLLCTHFFFFFIANGIEALTATSINSFLALQDDLCFHLLHCFLSSGPSLGFHLISSHYSRSSFHLLLSRLKVIDSVNSRVFTGLLYSATWAVPFLAGEGQWTPRLVPRSRLYSRETTTEVAIPLSTFCYVHIPTVPINHDRSVQGHLGRLRTLLDRARIQFSVGCCQAELS